MRSDFSQPIDRAHSDSIKWNRYPPDVIPLWVADMDFSSPPAVLQALTERVAHGVFGYGSESRKLTEVIVETLSRRYAWYINPEDVVYLPGVVTGFNLACIAFADGEKRVVVQSPVYPLLLNAPAVTGCNGAEVGFVRDSNGAYCMDWNGFEAILSRNAGLFVLCNPQNPLGRVFRRDELERMADCCLRQGAVICSDEIHCDLVYPGHSHLPIASLAPEIAQRTITLMAPSKSYNLAGLQCSFAIVQNQELRQRFMGAARGLLTHVNTLGCTAALAAYRHGDAWLAEVLQYLLGNRDTLVSFVREHLPELRMTTPEGTYLAWLDCSGYPPLERPYQFFLQHARVALSDGQHFGDTGRQHVRLNFACRRDLLLEALERMRRAVERARR